MAGVGVALSVKSGANSVEGVDVVKFNYEREVLMEILSKLLTED